MARCRPSRAVTSREHPIAKLYLLAGKTTQRAVESIDRRAQSQPNKAAKMLP